MLKRWLIEIAKRIEGSVIIEYAIVIPIFLLLVMGVIEYSLIMYGQAVLTGAMIDAAREAKTGYGNGVDSTPVQTACSGQATQSAYITCIVTQDVGGLFNPAKVGITAVVYSSFGGSPMTCSPQPCTVPTDGGDNIVVYTANYNWSIGTPFLQYLLPNDNNGVITLSATALVKNESTTSTTVPILSQ